MPNEKRTPFQQGYTNWDYNWSQVYMNVYAEAYALHYLFPKDERLTTDEGNIPPKEMMLETTQDYRENPNLLITGRMNKVSARKTRMTSRKKKPMKRNRRRSSPCGSDSANSALRWTRSRSKWLPRIRRALPSSG